MGFYYKNPNEIHLTDTKDHVGEEETTKKNVVSGGCKVIYLQCFGEANTNSKGFSIEFWLEEE